MALFRHSIADHVSRINKKYKTVGRNISLVLRKFGNSESRLYWIENNRESLLQIFSTQDVMEKLLELELEVDEELDIKENHLKINNTTNV